MLTSTYRYNDDEIFTVDPSRPETIGGLVAGRPHLRLRADCPVETVLTVMAHNNKRVAGIVDKDGILHGFLTRSALFGHLIIGSGFDVGASIDTSVIKSMTAGDVMIANPVFLPSELSVDDALAIMIEYGFHTMPVLDDGGILVGMAEISDLARVEQDKLHDEIDDRNALLSRLSDTNTPGGRHPAPLR